MPRCLMLLGIACFASHTIADDVSSSAPAESPAMRTIFNGKDLTGWDGDPRIWSVRDGVIHGESTEDVKTKGNTFLIWQDDEVGDFELRLSFRCSTENNSGIQYRSKHLTEGSPSNDWVVAGYQHEIRNEEKFPNVPCFIYDEKGKRGRICLVGEEATWDADGKHVVRDDLVTEEEFAELMRVDEWNDVVIHAEGDRIRHYLNGRLVLDFTDEHPELALSSGVLALQIHGGDPMWAEFKDIRVRELD